MSPRVRTVSTSNTRAGLLAFNRLMTTWSWISARALPRLPTLIAGIPELVELSSESLGGKRLIPRGLGHAVLGLPADLVPDLAAAGNTLGYVGAFAVGVFAQQAV